MILFPFRVPSPSLTRFGLVRHGQTQWNQEGRIQGQTDSPLTADGRMQARAWGQQLSGTAWDRIIVSDLGRARHTAELINEQLGIAITVDQRLREQDWGRWVGLTLAQIKAADGELLEQQIQAGWRFCPPAGENRLQVLKRSRKALAEAAARYAGQNLLVVTHEGVIRALLYQLSRRPARPGEAPPLLQPRHLHLLRHDGRRLGIETVNAMRLSE